MVRSALTLGLLSGGTGLSACGPAAAVITPLEPQQTAAYFGPPTLVWGAYESDADGFTGWGAPLGGEDTRWVAEIPGRPPRDVACAGDSIWWLERGYVAKLDPETGSEVWRRGLTAPTGVVVRGEQAYVSTAVDPTLLAFDLADGRPRPELDIDLGGRGGITGMTFYPGGFAAWANDDGADPTARMVLVEGGQVVGSFTLDPWVPRAPGPLLGDVEGTAPAAVAQDDVMIVQVQHRDLAQGAGVIEVDRVTGSVAPLVRTEGPLGAAVDPQGLGLWAALYDNEGRLVLERTGDRTRRPFRGGLEGDWPIGDFLAVADDGGVWADASYTPPGTFGSGLVRLDPGGTPSERWSAPFEQDIRVSTTGVLRVCR